MKNQVISTLEQEVMDIVWDKKRCLVKEVQQKLRPSKYIAYTTVLTVLQRLQKKGLVTAKRKGKVYVYSPKISKIRYSKNTAEIFIQKFFSSFGDIAIASFAESIEDLPKEKRNHLLELIKKYEKNK